MGALFDGKCYGTTADAVDAFFMSAPPAYTAGSTSYLSYYEKVSGVWKITRKSIASNGAITNLTQANAPVPTLSPCDESQQFTDGLSVGWMLAAILVLAWGLTKIRELVR